MCKTWDHGDPFSLTRGYVPACPFRPAQKWGGLRGTLRSLTQSGRPYPQFHLPEPRSSFPSRAVPALSGTPTLHHGPSSELPPSTARRVRNG